MATIYRTRSELVKALLRASAGSTRAAFKDHPKWGIDPRGKAARSVAKRVAGTIAADWPRLSAIAMAEAAMVANLVAPSTVGAPDAAEGRTGLLPARSAPELLTTRSVGLGAIIPKPARARTRSRAREDLRVIRRVQKAVGMMVGQTKHDAKSGVTDPVWAIIRAAALVDVLRLIDQMVPHRKR